METSETEYEQNGERERTAASNFISDVVETETWLKFRDETETSSETPRLETWSSRPRLETSKFVHFVEFVFWNVVVTSESNFFQISGIFPTCFGCFLPENTTNKQSLN